MLIILRQNKIRWDIYSLTNKNKIRLKILRRNLIKINNKQKYDREKGIRTMRKLEGNVIATGLKVGIVAARFNEFIVSKLVSGAEDGLVRHGANTDDIDIAWVPGAFEMPLVAKKMANSGKYDAIICLGAVIKGSTDHYDYVCAEVSKGIATVSMNSDVPVMFGVLTTNNIEQAIERAGTKAGNKGYDCALSAIETANLLKSLA